MIERVTRCLESGGWTALSRSKKEIRSRRHLHSTFWSHGAGNIHLPAWWIFLLQTPVSREEAQPGQRIGQVGNAVSTGLQDIFLDFLYPVQTLALIRRLRRSTYEHHHATKNVKGYARSYTSIATDFITCRNLDEIKESATEASSIETNPEIPLRKSIAKILGASDHTGFHEELWQSYQDLLQMSESLSAQELTRMLRCLVLSQRSIDVKRAVALFESIPVPQRRAIHYSHAVSAALILQDLDTAVAMHQEATSRINASVGTAAILRYAVQRELWSEAIKTWHTLWVHKLAYYATPDIWTAVDELPLDELITKAGSAADFARSIPESPGEKDAASARDFALELIRHTFSIHGKSFNVSRHGHLMQKAEKLSTSSANLTTLAMEQLLSTGSQEHGHRALMFYRRLRKTPEFKPTNELLTAVSKRVFAISSVSGTLMILEDWRAISGAVGLYIVRLAASVLARNGQLEALQNLFRSFVSEHGRPRSQFLYHRLLHVYNRRADTRGILQCLDDLRQNYDYEPDIKAWNYVIGTFARVGDVNVALSHYNHLRDLGIQADSTTYFHLMSMYSKRGDREAVLSLYEQCQVDGMPATVEMMDTLVLANINDERLEEAETLIDQALQMNFQTPLTYMWNVLINAYALRKEVEKVSQLHRRMQKAGIPLNGMTYAALMTSLSVAKYPDQANKILSVVMPRNRIKRTALHYAIVMGGYLPTGEYGKVFSLYKAMLESGVSPNMSTQNVLLRAAASVDKSTPAAEDGSPNPEQFLRAQQTFEQTLANLDPSELATSEPRKFVGANPLDEAFSATYFEYLIFLYGKEAAFTKASELYERYIKMYLPLRDGNQDIEASPPMRLLSALMAKHVRARDYNETDRCWKLAMDKSEQLARNSKASTSRQGWVLRSRRFIINLPLHQYIASLDTQGRTAELTETIDDLCNAGYALNSANWNSYIQAMVRSSQPSDRRLAFVLCERHLIPNWPGWSALGNKEFFKPKLRASQRDMLLMQDRKAPTYLTLVWLARAYLEAKSRGMSSIMRSLEKAGPKTMDAITNMPRLNDRPQTEILRQET